MTTVTNPGLQPEPPRPLAHVNPMTWSIRRELWENRSVWMAPLMVTAVVLSASLIATVVMAMRMRAEKGSLASVVKPLQVTPAAIMLTTFVVGFFFSLDALYGERRDRSILFWKSLPVSDRTTVLAKAAVPLAILPLIAWGLSVVTQLVLLLAGSAALGGTTSPLALFSELGFFSGLLIMFYGLAVHTLWFAPIYCLLLLVSGWAKRAPFLWVVLPPLAVAALEKIVFGSTHFLHLLQYRVAGAMSTAFSRPDGNINRLSELSPLVFLTTPGLWAGLLFAAGCLAAAIRLRRDREPI